MTNQLLSDANLSAVPSDYADNLTTRIPEEVLPPYYPIQITEEFLQSFCRDRIAHPPSPLRIALWEQTEGKTLWEERQREARLANERADQEYRRRVERVKEQNARVDRRNEELHREHLQKLAAHREAVAAHVRRYGGPRRTKLATKLRKRLSRVVENQHSVIEGLLRDIARQARRQTLQSWTYLLWLVLLLSYVWVFINRPVLAWLPALLTFGWWYGMMATHLERLRNWKNDVGLSVYGEDKYRSHKTFWTYHEKAEQRVRGGVYTPVYFLGGEELPHLTSQKVRESYPLGKRTEAESAVMPGVSVCLCVLISCIPLFSLFVVLHCLWEFASRVLVINVAQEARTATLERQRRLLAAFEAELTRAPFIAYLERQQKTPQAPPKLAALCKAPQPSQPEQIVAARPEPPSEYFDIGTQGNYTHTLRGPAVHTVSEVRNMARYVIFADGRIQPYFSFAGMPIPFYAGQANHCLCIGTTGSGKTTMMRMLMSALLPLTRKQAERIKTQSSVRSQRKPTSSHEWSRSFTHQAVIYNAKDENIPFLVALGFDPQSDLIILDPADSRCFAWDVARDINDRDSIFQFADLLVPTPKGSQEAGKDKTYWEKQARRIIRAIIISLRNAAKAAGKEPAWNLRDLVNAVETPEKLRAVLAYHDTPQRVISQLVDLHDAQASSVYMTATTYISEFEVAGERWAEAERQGRKISLKEWAKNGRHSVIVLPNTLSNVDINEPLNRALFKALTNIVLNHEYTVAVDADGNRRVHKRYFFLDEVGQAGRVPDLERLLSEGRASEVHVVMGLHQLSQLRETYGTNVAETILGLCSYLALLKAGDTTTAEWMSKRIGKILRSYDRESFTFGSNEGKVFARQKSRTLGTTHGTQQSTTTGETDTVSDTTGRTISTSRGGKNGRSSSTSKQESHTDAHASSIQHMEGSSEQDSESTTSGTNESESHGTNKSQTSSKELREEAAILPSQFLNLPDPATAGGISFYGIIPSLPVWRADEPFDALQPILEKPEALQETPPTMKWQNDEEVSRATSWSEDDLRRLCLVFGRIPNDQRLLDYERPHDGDDDADDDEADDDGPLDANFDF